MMRQSEFIDKINSGQLDNRICKLYCCDGEQIEFHRERMLRTISSYKAAFSSNNNPIMLYSSPGRTELGGNHTDHQHGCVLTASVNMDMLACAAPNDSNFIVITSEGYGTITVNLENIQPDETEKETSGALVSGVAAAIRDLGYEIKGFDAYVTSMIPAGSGLSSSAAYEVLIGTIISGISGCELDSLEVAQIGKFAENVYFGKPSGLLDQLGCSMGGIIAVDFKDEADVCKINYDLEASGYSLCIIDSGADHADLTDAYAAIPLEMGAAASMLGEKVLRHVDEDVFLSKIPEIRKELGDRAVLRSMHFFAENRRAQKMSKALEAGDFEGYLEFVKESGKSSGLYLQNLHVTETEQSVTIAICLAEHFLSGKGAVRVHGGGFAGTIQAYVPNAMENEFKAQMERLLGKDKCHFLSIRSVGGCAVVEE